MATNEQLTAASEAAFFARDAPLKAVLFTKKTETPKLWLRLAEEWSGSCDFAEVRLADADGEALMEKHAVREEDLPRVVAFVNNQDGASGDVGGHRPFNYEGPTEFDTISNFLGKMAMDVSGRTFLEMSHESTEKQKIIERLQGELEREQEAVALAKAEAARSMLDKVGQGEAMKKELAEAREREKAVEAEAGDLRAQLATLQIEIEAMREVHHSRVAKITASNLSAFLSNGTRPLKALLFTTKVSTPPLWLQLAENQATTTGTLEPVVYDGEVTLDALSSFLRDAVEGGDAVIAVRQQVHHAMREIERLSTQLSAANSEASMYKARCGELEAARQAASTASTAAGSSGCDKCPHLERQVLEAAEAAEALALRLRAPYGFS